MEILSTLYGSVQLLIVFFFIQFFVFFKSVNKMVDVVTNRMFETFNRFSPKDSDKNESLSSIINLKRFAKDQQLRKTFYADEIKNRENMLLNIKDEASIVEFCRKQPLQGLSCEFCTAASRESLVNKTTEKMALRNILDHTLPSSSTFLQRTFSHLHQVCQLKKFDYPQVTNMVLADERLKRAVEATSLQQLKDSDVNDDEFYQQLLRNNRKRAEKLLTGMKSTLSDFLLRFTSWILYKLLPCFLSCVVTHPGHIRMLKESSKTNLPMIFLPLHRSHLDYILISFILLNNDIRSPLVAAGDNLRIPFFGSLLRGLGAFFIKRRINPVMGRKDLLYKAVLHTYMNECLRAGHNIEFFLEGGRTRTGKPCMPKYGILSVIVEAFLNGTIEDALLVPVSVNYEKLVDGNFIREQLGQPKEMETFGNAISGIWHVLNSNYGMMRIDFNQPFSLRELVKTFNTSGKNEPTSSPKKPLKSNLSTTSLYGTDIVVEEHKSLVERLSKHIIYDCSKSTSVMSTNALAFLLLTKFRDGATTEELVQALDALREQLQRDWKDVGFTGDSTDVIDHAIKFLGPALVRKEKRNGQHFIKPIVVLPNVIELCYYGNTVISHFALDSIIAISIDLVKTASGTVKQTELLETTTELCDMLQYEFIFCKPCQSLEDTIMSSIGNLDIRNNIFISSHQEDDGRAIQSRKIAAQFDDEEDLDEASTEIEYTLNVEKASRDHLKYLKTLLMPLIETYSTTAFALEKLIGRDLLENELVSEILGEIKLQLSQGQLNYEECMSVDTIKNALKLYDKWDIVECHAENKLKLYYLKENHDQLESVKFVYERVSKFRQPSN